MNLLKTTAAATVFALGTTTSALASDYPPHPSLNSELQDKLDSSCKNANTTANLSSCVRAIINETYKLATDFSNGAKAQLRTTDHVLEQQIQNSLKHYCEDSFKAVTKGSETISAGFSNSLAASIQCANAIKTFGDDFDIAYPKDSWETLANHQRCMIKSKHCAEDYNATPDNLPAYTPWKYTEKPTI